MVLSYHTTCFPIRKANPNFIAAKSKIKPKLTIFSESPPFLFTNYNLYWNFFLLNL